MKSAKELVAEANTRVKIIAATDAKSLLNSADTVFVDLRDSAELQRWQDSRRGSRQSRDVGVRTRPDIAISQSGVLFGLPSRLRCPPCALCCHLGPSARETP